MNEVEPQSRVGAGRESSDSGEFARVFDRIVRSRRPVRGFLPDPVSRDVLERVFATAAFAPPNCNTRPTTLGYDADSVRRELGIDDSLKLLFGISFGYEDPKLPENQIEAARASLADSVFFHA